MFLAGSHLPLKIHPLFGHEKSAAGFSPAALFEVTIGRFASGKQLGYRFAILRHGERPLARAVEHLVERKAPLSSNLSRWTTSTNLVNDMPKPKLHLHQGSRNWDGK